MKTNSKKKVIVIGIDSASPDLIEKWVDQGKLPLFKKLMKNGCFSRLRSTIPPLTPPAWTSSLTGVNPGKHNVFDFFKNPSSHDKKLVTSADRKSKALWNILDQLNMRSIVVNVPNTYPAESFKGIMVSGMPTPQLDDDFIQPTNMREEILGLIEGKRIGVNLSQFLKNKEGQLIEEVEKSTERTTRLALSLCDKQNWDLSITVYDDLDRLQHVFWHYMDSKHPLHDKKKSLKYHDVILKHYQYLEKQIESYFSLIDKNTTLVIYSDHGMGPVYTNFFVNSYFLSRGWLKAKKPWIDVKYILEKLGISFEKIKYVSDLSKVSFIAKKLLSQRVKLLIKTNLPAESIELETTDWQKIVDWDKSKSVLYSRTSHGILINRQNVNNYESFRDELIHDLSVLTDPHTGKKVIKNIYKRENVYSGPYTKNAPDILLVPNKTYEIQEKIEDHIFNCVKKTKVAVSANHDPEGILFIYNKNNNLNKKTIKDARMVDIAPTILYSMGVPVPLEMEGKVLQQAFSENYIKENPLEYSDLPLSSELQSKKLTKKEEKIIADQLKAMGYME